MHATRRLQTPCGPKRERSRTRRAALPMRSARAVVVALPPWLWVCPLLLLVRCALCGLRPRPLMLAVARCLSRVVFARACPRLRGFVLGGPLRGRSCRRWCASRGLGWSKARPPKRACSLLVLSFGFCEVLNRLLSFEVSSVKSRGDFKKLRCTLTLLTSSVFLLQTLNELNAFLVTTNKTTETKQTKTDEEKELIEMKRIKTLASRGLFYKIPQIENTSVIGDFPKQTLDRIEKLFPDKPLPCSIPPLEEKEFDIEASEWIKQLKSMKRGAAPGLSGWTRELLLPLFACSNIRPHLVLFLNTVINNKTSNQIQIVFQTGILVALTYSNDKEKIRPIVIKDFLVRLAWKTALNQMENKKAEGSGYRMKNACGAVISCLQHLLDSKVDIVAYDISNCFNEIDRHIPIEVLRNEQCFSPLFPLLNLTYCSPLFVSIFDSKSDQVGRIKVTHGTHQGCPSGGWFLEVAKIITMSNLKTIYGLSFLSIADDIYQIGSLDLSDKVIVEFQKLQMRINLKKTKVITSNPSLSVPSCLSSVRVSHSVEEVLGGCVFPSPSLSNSDIFVSLQAALAKSLSRLRAGLTFISNMNASRQIKFLTLRAVQWYPIYFCESIPLPSLAIRILEHVENLHIECLQGILDFDGEFVALHPSLQVYYHTPIEDGGLGLLPLSCFAEHVAKNVQTTASMLAMEVNIMYPPSAPSVHFSSLHLLWKHIASTRKNLTTRLDQARGDHHSWLTAWPENPSSTLSDECFLFGVCYRLGFIRSPPITCLENDEKNITEEDELFDHIQSCRSCGSLFFHLRHECVNNALAKVWKRHSLPFILNPIGLPQPSNEKGGPDFLLFVGTTTYAGDVTITKNSPNTGYQNKIRKYCEFSSLTNYVTLPVALSSRGSLASRSLVAIQGIERASNSVGLLLDACNASQFALLVGLFNAFTVLLARGSSCSSFLSASTPISASFPGTKQTKPKHHTQHSPQHQPQQHHQLAKRLRESQCED